MVIILNGAGSSGKSTIARHLLKKMKEPTVYHGFDTLIPTLLPHRESFDSATDESQRNYICRLDDELYAKMNDKNLSLLPLVYEFIVPLSRGGFHVIVDTLLPGECINPLFRILDGIPTYLIGVRCSEKELCRRELLRGDRKQGSAIKSNNRVHVNMIYDIEIDTTNANADSCAKCISEHVSTSEPRGFTETKVLRLGGSL